MECPIIESIRSVDRGEHVGHRLYCFGGRVDELKGPLTARTGAMYISLILTDASVNVDFERMQATVFGRDEKSLPRVHPGDYIFLTNVKFQLRDHGSIHCVSTAKTTYFGWNPANHKTVTKSEKVLVTQEQLSILSKYFVNHYRELLARQNGHEAATVPPQQSNAPSKTWTEAPLTTPQHQQPATANVTVSKSNSYSDAFSKPRTLLRDLKAGMSASVVVQVIRALESGRRYVLQVSDFTSNDNFKTDVGAEEIGLPRGQYLMEVAPFDGSRTYCKENIECGAIITIDHLQLKMSPYGNLEARVNGDRTNPTRSFIRVLADEDPEAKAVIARRLQCLERLSRNDYENGLTLPPEPKFGKDAMNGLRADSKAVESSQHSIADRISEPRQSLSPSRYSDPPARTFDRAEYEMAASNLPSSQPEENVALKTEKRKNEESDDHASKYRKTVSQANESSQSPLTGKEHIAQPVQSSPSRPATVKLSSSCSML
ncbi:uncharacterized protein V1513DRAFT_80646 [Lipomyces chichibuensis]|uniref:uncharacterized protein n=1 Tax=Lipomyces chichibuensis TaxID=1546026 RepID=UPI0033435EB0